MTERMALLIPGLHVSVAEMMMGILEFYLCRPNVAKSDARGITRWL